MKKETWNFLSALSYLVCVVSGVLDGWLGNWDKAAFFIALAVLVRLTRDD